MAGTTNDNTTADDWRLASNELAFVTALVGPERVSEVMSLLLDDLAKGLIRWNCDDLGVDGDFQTNPSLSILFGEARGQSFFWREDSRGDVDLLTDRATWMGPLSGFRSDGRGKFRPVFNSYASTTLTASGIRFHHGDIVERLAAHGLMSPAAPMSEPTLPSSSPSPRSVPITPIEELRGEEPATPATAEPAPPSEFKPSGPQQEVIHGYVSEIFAGMLPNGITAAELEHAIDECLTREDEARGKKIKRRRPSRDSCARYIADWNRWNRQGANASERNP